MGSILTSQKVNSHHLAQPVGVQVCLVMSRAWTLTGTNTDVYEYVLLTLWWFE